MSDHFTDPRVVALCLLGLSAVAWLALSARGRRAAGRAGAVPLGRVWHPQETVTLTPAEERAFRQVVAHVRLRSEGRSR